jgi:hypothetical protein
MSVYCLNSLLLMIGMLAAHCSHLSYTPVPFIAVAGHQLECIHESCCVLGFMTTNDAPHQEL